MTPALLNRRLLLTASAGALVAGPACAKPASAAEARFANSPWRKVSDAEWKKRLAPLSYSVLRKEDTERPRSSALNAEKRKGTYVCGGCALPLFKSEWKFESGTGWPSFYTAVKENVGTKRDFILLVPRTEYHCARCLGHQGHIFDDGPKPTGQRWCNNGAALKFVAA